MYELKPQYARMCADSICIYNEPPTPSRKEKLHELPEEEKVIDHFQGVLSDYSRKKIRKIVTNWLTALKTVSGRRSRAKGLYQNRITFVTLTLSAHQEHTDQKIKRELLNFFLIKLQRRFDIKNYLWVAEKQGNGNIHFHILIDKYVHWKQIRAIWNTTQERLGYITRFEKKHSHRNPNSTDIHSLKDRRNATAYVCKYMTKKDESKLISGRIWSSTRALKDSEYYRTIITNDVNKILQDCISSKEFRVYRSQYVTFIYGNIGDIIGTSGTGVKAEYEVHYEAVFKKIYD